MLDGRIVQRLGFAILLVAVGCGSVSEPVPAPESEAPPPAAEEGRASAPKEPAQTAEETEAAPPAASATPSPGCKVGFQKDIMPKLVASCGQASCHSNEMNRPYIDAAAPVKTHEELMEFAFGSIEWSDPHADYSGASESSFKKAIDAWRLCGAKLD